MDRMAKIVAACIAISAGAWAVQAQYRVETPGGAAAPSVFGTQDQARRALVENCMASPDLQQRLTDIKTGRQTAIDCAEARKSPSPLDSAAVRGQPSTTAWPDRYLVQVQSEDGAWRNAEGGVYAEVGAAWDGAVAQCEPGQNVPTRLRSVKIVDTVTGLERIVDCRAPQRR